MMKKWICLVTLASALAACGSGGVTAQDAPVEPSAPAANVILDVNRSFWRLRTVWETEEVVEDGQVGHLRFVCDRSYFAKNPTHKLVEKYSTTQAEVVRLPAETSADWARPDFDDSAWIRTHGPLLDKSNDVNWKLILARGQFEVTDPAGAGELGLTVQFRGGCVVYLNGQELTRAFMPAGPVSLNTPATAYPRDVYLDAEGYVMFRKGRTDDESARLAKRTRTLAVKIPAAKLKKGINVLAIAIHRAPTDACFFLGRTKMSGQVNPPHNDTFWAKIGLADVQLVAPPGSTALPNVSRSPGKGFQAWNQSVVCNVFPSDWPDPFAAMQPIRLTGVRNGTFAGQVVVGDDKPIQGLKVQVSDLAGPGTIPASAVTVRYPLADGASPGRDLPGPFDSLEEAPPAEVAVFKESNSAIQPVWLTVAVPADAKPGDYAGKVTIIADGAGPLTVPLLLRVADWTLADHKAFLTRMDIVQSPESVALAYNVPLWSDEHFKLLDKTFSLLAPLSVKSLYVTCIRRTHWGNEHAMVRWFRNDQDELEPDFSIAEKYLDLAVRHLGTIPAVILYCWEPTESMGHAGGAGSATRTTDKPILFTLLDRKTGAVRPMRGPAWGTPEAKEFWTTLSDGMKKVLEKRGLADSMLFGLVGDARPTKQAMDDITAGVPNAKWAVHSHYYCVSWQGYDMGMAIALWGVGCSPTDPSDGHGYGWRNPFWLNYYPREMSLSSSLVDHRIKIENWVGAKSRSETVYSKAMGTHGLGRLGADFWPVVRAERGGRAASLAGRFPESYWGQLNLNYGIPHLLGRGKDGPLATVRSEAFRENIQEIEARVFIEKALLDAELRDRLGDELAGRCRRALNERIRMCMNAEGEGMTWFVSSGWSERTELLFALAAEVARKIGR